ncbi:glycoprotein-N-acetylgalactosamine 3-beta-galactosyltransferase 1 [Zeugodacus cucurbitae]|uniref:glycoprotein-N-acetylgalactosamine 3-beta-galactosyltransferase 1 n=1 Tax=Zeugodacus cucurbitae TaxID=28588 RepID=UPI0023D9200D|nr:glycoprotein-N-acetylgalactosamine 3-beta-galactosyltransferase 1 [Zeugodacus cucurbitae]
MLFSLKMLVQRRILYFRGIFLLLVVVSIIYTYLAYKRNVLNWENFTGATRKVANEAENSLTEQLIDNVRILCWIMTNPANHKTKAIHVRRTWGRRCNRLIFVTTEETDELGETFVLHNFTDTYDALWMKTRRAFKHVYEKYANEMDWFMKADDDTFVLVENLRYYLYAYSPDMPIYFGHDFKLKHKVENHYMSGGAGYVLSREALSRFINDAVPNEVLCPPEDEQTPEDWAIGNCLRSVGVLPGDSRDAHNELRFIPFNPGTLLTAGYLSEEDWYFTYRVYHPRECQDCLSKHAVSFHYMTQKYMYLTDFFLYKFQLYTPLHENEVLPKKLRLEEVKIPAKINAWDITIEKA